MEKTVFVISMIGTVILAALGITFFFLLGSEAVLLDGLFTLLGIPTAFVGLYVAKVSKEAPTEDYPVGLGQARPMLELFKSIFLLGLITIAMLSALDTLLSGGSSIEGGPVALYGGIAMLACFLIALVISLMGGKKPSSLVKLERFQWVQDGILSGIIGLTFGLVAWVDHPWVALAGPYLDQVLVILLALIFIPFYIKTIAKSGRQLLIGSPEKDLRETAHELLGSKLRELNHPDFNITPVSVAGITLVDVEILVKTQIPTHHEALELKKQIESALASLESESKIWLSFFPSEENT